MPFNSIDFAIFFPIIFFIYWFCLNKNLKYQNVFIVIASFVFWGFLNAVYFLPLLLTHRNRKNMEIVANNSALPSLTEFLQIIVTFTLTIFAWIFFRADSMAHACSYISGIFSSSLFTFPDILMEKKMLYILVALFFFLIIEWMGRRGKYALEGFGLT